MSSAHVFISYSRKDTTFVERLERDLNARGIFTWRDVHSIPGGAAWFRRIQAGLQASYALLYIDTPHAAESEWVEQEFLFALALRLPIIPVRLDEDFLSFATIRLNPIVCDTVRYESGLARIFAELDKLTRQPIVPGAQLPTLRQPPATALLPLDADAVRDYLSWVLINAHADLRDALYVELEAVPEHGVPLPQKSALAAGLDDDHFDFSAVGLEHLPNDDFARAGDEVADPRAAIRDLRRSVLLGDPGAGKTTTLLKLTVELARAAQSDPAAKLPVFVPLRQFSGVTDFATFVQMQTYTLQDLYPTLSASGRLFLLCDALDEMPRRGKDDGRDLVAEVRAYLHSQPDWVVSCRVRDYTDDLNGIEGIGRIRLKPLDPPRIHDFIQRKYAGWGQSAVGDALWRDLRGSDHLLSFWQKASERGESEQFWDASAGLPYTSLDEYRAWSALHADHRHLLALCRSPFLTNMICVLYRELHRRGEALPDNRAGLYAGFIENLLRAEARRCAEVGLTWLGDAPIRAGLGQIAWVLGAQTEIARAAAETSLRTHVPDHEPAAILSAAASAGLIDYGSNVRFTHQLLQQYFAAAVLGRMMDAGDDPAAIWQPAVWWRSTGREETAILLAGDRNAPEHVARWLAAAQPHLALELLLQPDFRIDLNHLEPGTRATLVEAAQARTSEPDPVGRAAAYRVLGRLNADARRGVGLRPDGLPDIDWVEIPEGAFIYQEDILMTLPTFCISRYPVTCAQFQAFANAPDYDDDRWWAGMPQEEEAFGTTYRTRRLSEQAFKFANHPRDSVAWYQAVAFTRWLTARYTQHNLWDTLAGTTPVSPNAAFIITLPTEEQWEKAARGTDGRTYPYGDTFDAAKGNTEETGIGQTSAVGIFPDGASPYGVLDMSGNVREWCLNKYDAPDDTAVDTSGVRRVVRGGSWNNYQLNARAAFRNFFNPFNRYNPLGFRVVGWRPDLTRVGF